MQGNIPTSPGTAAPQNMQGMNQAVTERSMAYQTVFPEVYYRLQPYVMMACDQMDMYGNAMPTQEMVERMSDGIYDDMNRMYPDMAEYMRDYEQKANNDPADPADPPIFGRGPMMFGRRFRRRGLFRDLIDILLLSELFRRRRRYY